MSDEFLPVGQLSNKNKLVETSSSGTVAPLVASWAQASTASMGALAASTEIIGYVKIDQTTPGTSNAVTVATTSGGILFSTGLPGKVQALASTAKIGALQASTESIGLITALVSTAKIGALQASTESIGYVTALVSTAKIGALQASTESIGYVTGLVSTAQIGRVINDPSTEIIGYVKIDQTTPGASNAVVVTTTSGAALFSTGLTGKVQALASTEVIGYIVANASTAKIGALQASTESIGYVTALVSTAKIGALQASTESIGYVTALVSTAKIGALQASTENIGNVTVAAALPVGGNRIGNVTIVATDNTPVEVFGGSGDGLDAGRQNLETLAKGMGFNGVTWDRQRNNIEGTLLASTARSTTATSADQINYNHRGVICYLDVTAATGAAPSLQFYIAGKDAASGKYFYLANTGLISTGGTFGLLCYPGATDAGARFDGENNVPLPRTWRVEVAHTSSSAWTYSVGYALIL